MGTDIGLIPGAPDAGGDIELPRNGEEPVALRSGQPDAAIQHPAAELVQGREGQLQMIMNWAGALTSCGSNKGGVI